MVMTDIIERSYENLSDDETEEVRQHLAARMNLMNMARREAQRQHDLGDIVSGFGDRIVEVEFRYLIILGDERACHVAGANAQCHEHRSPQGRGVVRLPHHREGQEHHYR